MTPHAPHTRTRRLATFALLLGVGVLAALFWGRLKLVTGIPRTAYAEPDTSRADADRLAASENAAPPVE